MAKVGAGKVGEVGKVCSGYAVDFMGGGSGRWWVRSVVGKMACPVVGMGVHG